VADVVGEIEVGIIDPDRPTHPEGHEAQLLPEAGHQVQARLDVVAELPIAGRRTLEERGRGHVHVRPIPLQMEE
jgi:hypothetical protein